MQSCVFKFYLLRTRIDSNGLKIMIVSLLCYIYNNVFMSIIHTSCSCKCIWFPVHVAIYRMLFIHDYVMV